MRILRSISAEDDFAALRLESNCAYGPGPLAQAVTLRAFGACMSLAKAGPHFSYSSVNLGLETAGVRRQRP